MAKLKIEGYELLDPGTRVLEVVDVGTTNEYGPQIRLKLRVAAGESEGFVFYDWANCSSKNGVKAGTKLWDIFEACLNRPLSADEELDTDHLVNEQFEARVLVRRSGKGNLIEHGSIAPSRRQKVEPKDDSESGGSSDFATDDPFNWD